MNLVGIITRDEAKLLISKETGRTVEGDGEIIILHEDDLADIINNLDSNVMYFGDFEHQAFDKLRLLIMKESFMTAPGGDVMILDQNSPSAAPSTYRNKMWNKPANFPSNAGSIQFDGYKFKLKTAWDLMTLGSLTNGAGWAIASGINTHSSGTTEATYGYAFETKHYRFTIDISGVTAGSLVLSTDAVAAIGTITADGLQTFEWDGDATDTALYLTPTADFDGGYDTATLKLEVFNKY